MKLVGPFQIAHAIWTVQSPLCIKRFVASLGWLPTTAQTGMYTPQMVLILRSQVDEHGPKSATVSKRQGAKPWIHGSFGWEDGGRGGHVLPLSGKVYIQVLRLSRRKSGSLAAED